ncbi:inhibitor of nuclear factor kappa-B kinase subunit epsilon isoform X1 [Labeo rohita]|uniref:Inhibitor of nuclear factor kappa-B kinase subunit epsilon isoform X1 n=1 Tax=Labeo rohita TaxID=84645 RepID=A0A498MPX4_LABRO|nr:inhibitor of nuclear factor kappa-B kinase subunit epsilon isoform X1 [Labeo rohita]
MKVVNLPPTTPERPIILISRRPEKLVGYPYREPDTPAMPTKFDVMADYSFSKIEEDLQRMYGSGVREFQNQLQHLHVMLSKHSETLAQDKSIQKMEVLLGKIVAVHQQYCKDRMTGKLCYNDEQIHKFEKLNLSSYIKKVKSLFKDDCLQKYQDVLMAAGNWNRVLYEMQTSLEHFGVVLRQRMGDLHVCEAQQNKVLGRAVLRALQQPVGAEGVDGQKKDEQMIFKMNRLKDEMEAVARELQNNNNMIESLAVVTATLPVEKKVPQANRP